MEYAFFAVMSVLPFHITQLGRKFEMGSKAVKFTELHQIG